MVCNWASFAIHSSDIGGAWDFLLNASLPSAGVRWNLPLVGVLGADEWFITSLGTRGRQFG